MDDTPKTKEGQYSLLFDVKEKHGISRLGLMVNESWNQDPKRTLFTLARYKFVARMLRQAGLGTLLFDLMTVEEEQSEAHTRHLRFDIEFLSSRLVAATQWVLAQHATASIGYFGSSTGAAAALLAAVESGNLIQAVVSRGGRPDLAGASLERVRAPTLLILGGDDTEVISLNKTAYARLHCEKAFRIVAGATHLFEETGTLEQVATMASEWFATHLSVTPAQK
jgi:dienelactone hydrolase